MSRNRIEWVYTYVFWTSAIVIRHGVLWFADLHPIKP